MTEFESARKLAAFADAVLGAGEPFLSEFENALRRTRAWYAAMLWREELFRPLPGPEEGKWRDRLRRIGMVLDALDGASSMDFPDGVLHPGWPAILRAAARAARSAAARRFYQRSVAALHGAAVERPDVKDLTAVHEAAVGLLSDIERLRAEEPRPEPGLV